MFHEYSTNIDIFAQWVGADMSSSVHDGNKKKDILVFRNGPTDRLQDTTLTAERKYSE